MRKDAQTGDLTGSRVPSSRRSTAPLPSERKRANPSASEPKRASGYPPPLLPTLSAGFEAPLCHWTCSLVRHWQVTPTDAVTPSPWGEGRDEGDSDNPIPKSSSETLSNDLCLGSHSAFRNSFIPHHLPREVGHRLSKAPKKFRLLSPCLCFMRLLWLFLTAPAKPGKSIRN